MNMDENQIAGAITKRTRAVVPVHYAGVACAMDEILEIAHKHNLLVIEDAAQALLATHKDQFLGTIGDIGALSFHETKNIISGEGGAILINRADLIERAEILLEKGTNRKKFFNGEVDKYTWVNLGSSYLPSEITAGFLWAQLEMAETIVARRNRIFEQYQNLLSPLADAGMIDLPVASAQSTCNGHIFYVITTSAGERALLIDYLAQQDIHAVFHYTPLHSSPAGKKFARAAGHLPYTDALSQRLLRLPLFYEMSDQQVRQVTDALYRFYEKNNYL
jgi:dTDP-4-amino-4,6-dideoxygalactose transaminase